MGKSCAESTGCNIVWTPLGSIWNCILAEVNGFLKSKENILICLPSSSSIPDLLRRLKDISNKIIVLNDIRRLETYDVRHCEEVFLENRSHELYCCVKQCKGSLQMMSSLLALTGFYHYNRCTGPPSCPRCKETGLLDFSIKSVAKRFSNLVPYLHECLVYLDKHGEDFSLFDTNSVKIGVLQNKLQEFEELLNNSNQRDDCVASAFKLMLNVDAALMDNSYTLAEALNQQRMHCLRLINNLMNSLQLPNPKNRDELTKFCINHCKIIVATADCIWKLHDMETNPFDVLLVLGSNQIKEVELIVPFRHPVKHTILFGDPHHLQPTVQSEVNLLVYTNLFFWM